MAYEDDRELHPGFFRDVSDSVDVRPDSTQKVLRFIIYLFYLFI